MTTILLVEDAKDLAQVIQRELEALEYEVRIAYDGVEALRLHAAHEPDLVILDWMLPRLDGLEVLRRIRQDAVTPILMLTARSEEADRVTLDGEPVDLTRTEFDLLHLLLRNPGRAFSRSYLMDTVWGQTYVGGDRSVDNAILRLRRKLGEWGDAIETVWGVGYRLAAAGWQPEE
jgi:DNA-binding response OmpR family regulator